jgi:hypothetical protein
MKNEKSSYAVALAKAIQNRCIKEAQMGFRDASVRGLCSEGAMEAAISAMQMMDVEKIVRDFDPSEK